MRTSKLLNIVFFSVEKAVSQLPHILPDYMLVFSIPILAHDSYFERFDNLEQLKVIY